MSDTANTTPARPNTFYPEQFGTLVDSHDRLRTWHEVFQHNVKSGFSRATSVKRANQAIGTTPAEMVNQQAQLYTELLDGLFEPASWPLVGLVETSVQLLGDPNFRKGLFMCWRPEKLFGLSISKPEAIETMGVAGIVHRLLDGKLPPTTDWGYEAIELDLPISGRKRISALASENDVVPVWRHPLFAATRH